MTKEEEQIEKAKKDVNLITNLLKEDIPEYRRILLQTKLHNTKIFLKIAESEDKIRKLKEYISLLEMDQIHIGQSKNKIQ